MSLFKFISFDEYVVRHLKANKDENEREFRKRLREAVDAKKSGRLCDCGNPIWAVGSAVVGYMCFSCITGEANHSGDFEINEVLGQSLGRDRNDHERGPSQEAPCRSFTGIKTTK